MVKAAAGDRVADTEGFADAVVSRIAEVQIAGGIDRELAYLVDGRAGGRAAIPGEPAAAGANHGGDHVADVDLTNSRIDTRSEKVDVYARGVRSTMPAGAVDRGAGGRGPLSPPKPAVPEVPAMVEIVPAGVIMRTRCPLDSVT